MPNYAWVVPMGALLLLGLGVGTAQAASPGSVNAQPARVVLSAAPRPVVVGQELTVTVTIINSSSRTVRRPVLDAVTTSPATGPIGLKTTDCSGTDGAGGHYVCTLHTLAPNGRETVRLRASTRGAKVGTKILVGAQVLSRSGSGISNDPSTRVLVTSPSP